MATQGPELNGLKFVMFTSDEIRRLSVVEVVTPLGLNLLGHVLKDSLYDPRMGPSSEHGDPCHTCKQPFRNCPGHFGRIELPLTVVNPLFHKALYTILRMSCLECHRILLSGKVKALLIYQLKLLNMGLISELEKLSDIASTSTKGESDNVVEAMFIEDFEKLLQGFKCPFNSTTESTVLTESLKRHALAEALKQQLKAKSCPYCKANFLTVQTFENRLMIPHVEIAEKYSKEKRSKTQILPNESREILRSVWNNDKEIMLGLFPVFKNLLEHPTDVFFMDCLLVPPPKVRPLNFLNGKTVENIQSKIYKTILNDCIVIKHLSRLANENDVEKLTDEVKAIVDSVRGDNTLEKLNRAWGDLQTNVDRLLDSERTCGLKQVVEKKEGLVRMHMMGKRVNYAARSVITPDPNLNVEEIGIPDYFAKKLSYPVPVNSFNVDELRKMVLNGPDVYPGAVLIEKEDGTVKKLFGGKNRKKRLAIAKTLLKSLKGDKLGGTIVHRHIVNGDVLLLNRQPTLHRPSIMAHRARILPGEKTLRMHYSNCKSYNADFDGDEMNVHCPQSELSRSEALHIVKVSNQYLVPKDGTPLGGLIQDHVVSGVYLTVRGRFFNKHDYQQLVYQGLTHLKRPIKLLPPTILKPKQLWSGKQVISTVLLNIIPENKEAITLTSSAKINAASWQKFPPTKQIFLDANEMSEAVVLIQRGHLLSGVLDKQHYGATQYGLTHCLYELYGGDCSTQFLSALGKIFTYHLQLIGFTLGVEDILVMKKPDKQRREIVAKSRLIGDLTAAKALDLDQVPEDLKSRLEHAYFSDRKRFSAKLDHQYKQSLDEFTNNINQICLPGGLIQKFPKNNLQLMVTSGAKGSTVNTMQISCLLGQIELEGKRPPLMISGKSLPSFVPFETSPKAGGYIDGRFMTGITPQDFFFHCMAGREGLIDTAVKTSRSGYLQRCLIKHLEGLSVAYDHTVRNHDGSVIQFAYGEDGLEVSKSTFLNRKQMEFLYRNRHAIFDKTILQKFSDTDISQAVEAYKDQLNRWHAADKSEKNKSPFTAFSTKYSNKPKYLERDEYSGRTKCYFKSLKKWKKFSLDEKLNFTFGRCPDPITSKFYPQRDFGVITEYLEGLIQDYVAANQASSKMAKTVKNLISLKSLMSLCEPGEPVGLLAAQSIGEPSTQMTLNTFHFAGRGDMNVTLGIPRLREILMTASKNIKTPSMDIPFKPVRKIDRKAHKFRRIFQRVTVADVLEKVIVKEKLVINPTRVFTYTVRFEFLPHACYKNEFVVTPQMILKHMEREFLFRLSKEIRSLGKKFGDIIHTNQKEKEGQENHDNDDYIDDGNLDNVDAAGLQKKKSFGEEHESSDEEGELDDDDATKAKLRAKHEEALEYDDDDAGSDVGLKSDEENEEEIVNEENVDEEHLEIDNEELKKATNREQVVLGTFSIVRNYKYDIAKEEWCEIVIGVPLTLCKIDFSSLLKEVAGKSVIYEVQNIRRAIVCNNEATVSLKTEGINIVEMFKHDRILNLNELYCNDIHKMAETYGIEAAGRVLIKELKTVFGVYGIVINPRHLTLIADYMTSQGVFLPMSRTGMIDSPSSLQQISFESATNFLKNALFHGKVDSMRSPSARIIAGRPCLSGTGCFKILTPNC